MTIRTTKTTVKIEQPFSLRGCAQSLEPGTYLIETDEELLEGLSFSAYKRTETFIHLHSTLGRPGVERVLSVSGDDLDAVIGNGRRANDLALGARLAGDAGVLADLNAVDRADDERLTRARRTD